MQFFIIITVQRTDDRTSRIEQDTRWFTATAQPGATRLKLFEWARAQLPEHLREAVVLFFSAEPNAVTGSAGNQQGEAA